MRQGIVRNVAAVQTVYLLQRSLGKRVFLRVREDGWKLLWKPGLQQLQNCRKASFDNLPALDLLMKSSPDGDAQQYLCSESLLRKVDVNSFECPQNWISLSCLQSHSL